MVPLDISEAARADLKAIWRQGAEMFGEAQADHYGAGLKKAFTLIRTFPRAARGREALMAAVRVASYKTHVIIYELNEHRILILRVRHAHEDWISDPLGSADSEEDPS